VFDARSNPVSAVPGLTPASPVMIDGPALVTVVPPRTTNVDAEPKGTAVAELTFAPLESEPFGFCGPIIEFESRGPDGTFDSHAANRNMASAIDSTTIGFIVSLVNMSERTFAFFMDPPHYQR
jgi:hypothetical protein